MFDAVIPQVDVRLLAAYLEQSVENGERFEEGEIVAIGSMLFRVAKMGDLLTLQEPDLVSFPIEWTVGVSRSMRLLRLQKDVIESFSLDDEIDLPSIRSSLLVGVDLKQDAQVLLLERTRSVEPDSGWFIGRLDSRLEYNDEVNLTRISVYQAILNWPQIAGCLGLPPGCRVELAGANTIFLRDGKRLDVKTGSLFDVLAGGSHFTQ